MRDLNTPFKNACLSIFSTYKTDILKSLKKTSLYFCMQQKKALKWQIVPHDRTVILTDGRGILKTLHPFTFVQSFFRQLYLLICLLLKTCCAAIFLYFTLLYSNFIAKQSHNHTDSSTWCYLQFMCVEKVCYSSCHSCWERELRTLRGHLISFWSTCLVQTSCPVSRQLKIWVEYQTVWLHDNQHCASFSSR